MTIQIDIDTHVIPLLEAVEWMGAASHKLSELSALSSVAPELQRYFGGIYDPDPLNACELMGGVTWVAKNLLQVMQKIDGGEA